MKTKKKLLGYYDYTVVLTYCGMLSAVVGIFMVMQSRFLQGIVCLMLAGICDMFDGAVASTKNRTVSEKKFGIQIDSLSDLISFGVLPGMFVYCLLSQTMAAGLAACVYILAALIRLAYFNVLEEERQAQTTERRTSYLGVPVTTIALVLPAVYILFDAGIFRTRMVFPMTLLLMAVGFLAPIQVPKPHKLGKAAMGVIGLLELVGLFLRMGGGL